MLSKQNCGGLLVYYAHPWGTHIFRTYIRDLPLQRVTFYRKSLNMGPLFYKNIPKHGSLLPNCSNFWACEHLKIVQNGPYILRKIPQKPCGQRKLELSQKAPQYAPTVSRLVCESPQFDPNARGHTSLTLFSTLLSFLLWETCLFFFLLIFWNTYSFPITL